MTETFPVRGRVIAATIKLVVPRAATGGCAASGVVNK
jgi:hypothetical protein